MTWCHLVQKGSVCSTVGSVPPSEAVLLLPNPVIYHQLFQTLTKTRQQIYMCLSPRLRIKTWQVQVKTPGYTSLLRDNHCPEFLYKLFLLVYLNHLISRIVLHVMWGFFCHFFIGKIYHNIKFTVLTTFKYTIQ